MAVYSEILPRYTDSAWSKSSGITASATQLTFPSGGGHAIYSYTYSNLPALLSGEAYFRHFLFSTSVEANIFIYGLDDAEAVDHVISIAVPKFKTGMPLTLEYSLILPTMTITQLFFGIYCSSAGAVGNCNLMLRKDS